MKPSEASRAISTSKIDLEDYSLFKRLREAEDEYENSVKLDCTVVTTTKMNGKYSLSYKVEYGPQNVKWIETCD